MPCPAVALPVLRPRLRPIPCTATAHSSDRRHRTLGYCLNFIGREMSAALSWPGLKCEAPYIMHDTSDKSIVKIDSSPMLALVRTDYHLLKDAAHHGLHCHGTTWHGLSAGAADAATCATCRLGQMPGPPCTITKPHHYQTTKPLHLKLVDDISVLPASDHHCSE